MSTASSRFFKPTARQCALVLLRVLQEREHRRGKPMTRARLSETMLERLWRRERLTQSWLSEVNDWVLTAGWTMVDAGSTYGIVKTEVVRNWPRVAYEHVKKELEAQDNVEEYIDGLAAELITGDSGTAEDSDPEIKGEKPRTG